MFDEFNGLPLHILVNHAAVVGVPLSAVLGVLFVVPRTRRWARWPFVLVSLGGLLAVYVAKLTGEQLKAVLAGADPQAWAASPVGQLVTEHQDRGTLLLYMMIGYAAVAVVSFAATMGRRRYAGRGSLAWSALVVAGAVVVVVQVYRVGDIGAKAVWNPTGNVDYSTSAPPFSVANGSAAAVQ